MTQIIGEAVRQLSEVFVRGVVSGDMVDRGIENTLIYLMLNRIVQMPDFMVPEGVVIGRKDEPPGTTLYEFHLLKLIEGRDPDLPSVFRVKMGGPEHQVMDWYYAVESPSNNGVMMTARYYPFLYDVFRVYEHVFKVKLVDGKW